MKDKNLKNIFLLIAQVGFAMAACSVFLKFIPISDGNWIELGMGLPVCVSCFIAIAFTFFKNYFAAFFVAIFDLFFLLHETVVFYDAKAVELGREIATETDPGYFRFAFDIYKDAFLHSSDTQIHASQAGTQAIAAGAQLAFVGLTLAFIFVTVAWILKVVEDNSKAALEAEEDVKEDDLNTEANVA